MAGDVPLLERLAQLPPVPASAAVSLLERLPEPHTDPLIGALVEGLTGMWNAAVRAAVVTRLRASGLPADDLLLRLQALSPTLGFAAEQGDASRRWLSDPFTQDALLVQQCVVRVLFAVRSMAETRALELTTQSG